MDKNIRYNILVRNERKDIKNTVFYFVISDSSTSCILTKRRSNPSFGYLRSIRGHLFANCSGPVYSTCTFIVTRCVRESCLQNRA